MQLAARMEGIAPFHVMELMARAQALEAQSLDFGTHSPRRYMRFAYTVAEERLAEGLARMARLFGK